MLPRWAKVSLLVFAVLALGALAFAVFEPIQVLPRIRLGPGFGFVDQNGERFSSEDARGKVVIYTFAYGDCGDQCESIYATMREIAERVDVEADLGDTELKMVTVSIDPANDADRLAELAARSGADGDRWVWMTTDPEGVELVVKGGFETWFEQRDGGGFDFDTRFVIVDGWGIIRGEYRYATVASIADTVVRHVGVLGEELRKSTGAASLAYEAAHLFLCYP